MVEMAHIVHNDYRRITDRVIWLAQDYVLNFNVDLAYKRKNQNGLENFHKEIGYDYNGSHMVKITRNFTYYLSIESTKNGHRIAIGPNSIYFLRFKLNEIINTWFRNGSIFANDNGNIIIANQVDPIVVMVDFGDAIQFNPSVMTQGSTDLMGIMCYITKDDEGFFMDINNLLSFAYLISNFNMYESAQLMLNYISRPENGTNYYEMSQNGNTFNQAPKSHESFFKINKGPDGN